MIHQLIFAHPRPGMPESEFQRYWVEEHAVRYASKIPQFRRYCVDTRLPFPPDDADPLWSGVAEIWLENEEEQLASLQSEAFLQGARLDEPRWAAFWRTLVLDTDTHVVIDDDRAQDAERPEVKLFVLVKRREGVTLDEFRRRSLETHPAIVKQIPGLRRYHQNHTRDALYGIGEAVLDAAYEFWFDDLDALKAGLDSPQFAEVTSDLKSFVNPRYVHRLAVKENWIIGPGAP